MVATQRYTELSLTRSRISAGVTAQHFDQPASVDEGRECGEGRASGRVCAQGDQAANAAYNLLAALA
jgi:hypothetical protein